MTSLIDDSGSSTTSPAKPRTRYRVSGGGATVKPSWRPRNRRRMSGFTVKPARPSVDASNTVDASDVYPEIAGLFRVPEDEFFESGFESDFGRALSRAIRRLGDHGMEAISHIICTQRARPHVLEEALRVLGRLEDESTKPYRRWLLERALQSGNPSIRDAAGLGIADMDDPASIPALRDAIAVESSHALRKDLTMVLRQLESHGTTASQT